MDWESRQEFRYEYHRGEVVMMAGGTLDHSQISSNVVGSLRYALRNKNCRALNGDLKVQLAESYVYPDAFVICGDVEFAENRRDIVKNPCLLVEVLSDSTEQYDRSGKFEQYRKLPSFREYVLISQQKPAVEVFFRQDDKHWLMTVTNDMDDTVHLQSLDVTLTMREIYEKTALA